MEVSLGEGLGVAGALVAGALAVDDGSGEDEVAVVLARRTRWHCWVVSEVMACAVPLLAGAASEAAATPKLAADMTRKPPAAMLIAGRTCAKRMKALPLLFVAPAKRVFSMD